MKRQKILFHIALLITPMILSFIQIESAVKDPIVEVMTPKVIHNGAQAIDWNLEDIMSDTNFTFLSLAGKVVMMDFFATWCGPCIAAMSLLREINDHYSGNSDFVLMSIDLETAAAASETALEAFASNNNMNWKIFRDTVNMDDYYGIEFIPTLIIFSKTQYVYYSEIGMSGISDLIDMVDDLLALSDTTDPVINEIESDKTSFSVLDNRFQIMANVTDENIRHVGYELEMGGYSDFTDFWVPSTNLVDFEFVIDPATIYEATQLGITNTTVDVLVEDFADRTATENITIDIDNMVDMEHPTVSITDIIETDATFGQNIEVIATITDDLLLVDAAVEILLNGDSYKLDALELVTDDTYSIKYYGLAVEKGDILTVNVTGEDVAGKIAFDELNYSVTASAGISLPIILASTFLAGLIILPIRRIRTRK